MRALIHFLLSHGYVVLFGFVFAEQIGLPIPAVPVLLAMGALIGRGHFGLMPCLFVAAFAATLSDYVWYELGRRHGRAIVNLVCRISLEPDTCVRRTTRAFARLGLRSLLVAKFIPGLSTAAPPLAGVTGKSARRFLLADLAGSLLWAGAFLGLGFVLSEQLEEAAAWALRLGSWLLLILAGALAAYIARKYYERRRFLRSLRMARISAKELKSRIDAGEEIAIVDLRHPAELASDGVTLPGALRWTPDEFEKHYADIPRGRELVLYCS